MLFRSIIPFCHFGRVEKNKVNFKRLSDLLGIILMKKHANTVSHSSSYLQELHVSVLVLSIYLLNNSRPPSTRCTWHFKRKIFIKRK